MAARHFLLCGRSLQAAIRNEEEDLVAASSLLQEAQNRVQKNGAAVALNYCNELYYSRCITRLFIGFKHTPLHTCAGIVAASIGDLQINEACITYKQGSFAAAAAAFSSALDMSGGQAVSFDVCSSSVFLPCSSR